MKIRAKILGGLVGSLISTSAMAAIDIHSDGADRIRLAGQLRTLTQQVAASSCALSSGIDVEESYEVLLHATQAFDHYIAALKEGNPEFNIVGPEKRKRTLHDIDMVLEEWSIVHKAVDQILEEMGNVEAAHLIDDENLILLELTTILSSDISAQYAHPYEITGTDAMAMEVVGRQRMLTQKMAKDACEIWTAYHSEEAKEDLVKTMAIFEGSLKALRFGMEAVGIQAAPNEKIRKDLDSLLERWDVVKLDFDLLLQGKELTDDQKTEIFHLMQVELEELEHLLHDYSEYAERNH